MRSRAFVISSQVVGLLAGIALIFTGGCGSVDVNPFLDADRYFTIYGSLDMDFHVQHLRVIPIDREIGAIDRTIDADVTTTDLSDGQTWRWEDSVFTFTDGSIGHVFTSRFRVQAGRTYRTEVRRSDGALSWAETTVPEQPKAYLGDADISSPPEWSFPRGTQKIFWQGVTREPHRVDVYYRFKERDDQPFMDFGVSYDTKSTSDDTSEGWEVTVRYTSDYEYLKREYLGGNSWPLVGVLMRVQVVSIDWVPPGGVWDPEVLVQPGTLSNVHDGFGFIGSSARFSVEWIP